MQICARLSLYEAHRPKKSRSPKAPAVQLVVCPDKLKLLVWGRAPSPVQAEQSSAVAAITATLGSIATYALRRGRTVKSRTCARMLDICIPFSCDRYGITSATN